METSQNYHAKPPVRSGIMMQVRMKPDLRDAISAAAVARGMNSSEWVRGACRTVAMLEGVLHPDVRSDGKRRYARIEGGAIVDVAYLPDVPTPDDPS